MGKPLAAAEGEVDFAADITAYYADHIDEITGDTPIPIEGEGQAVIRRSPLGVLLGIMPWNFPYYQVARFVGPNVVNGNTILLKHAPQCPESALAIAQIFDDAEAELGAHDSVYVNIFATNEQIATVIADPRVQGVSVTGSERAGSAVAELAGKHLKKVVLELGGSDPFILLSTDDLDAAVQLRQVPAPQRNLVRPFLLATLATVPDQLHDLLAPRQCRLEEHLAAQAVQTPLATLTLLFGRSPAIDVAHARVAAGRGRHAQPALRSL